MSPTTLTEPPSIRQPSHNFRTYEVDIEMVEVDLADPNDNASGPPTYHQSQNQDRGRRQRQPSGQRLMTRFQVLRRMRKAQIIVGVAAVVFLAIMVPLSVLLWEYSRDSENSE